MTSDSDASPRAAGSPRIIPRAGHPISRRHISSNALRVLYRLREGGYQAFLVGGCLRDLMIGVVPKDFDVATSARPEEVKRLFRNCRLIGRRFRLAHVFFGHEIIEVATFRAASAPLPGEETEDDPDILLEVGASEDNPESEAEEDAARERDAGLEEEDEPPPPVEAGSASHPGDRLLDQGGRILRDNTYGTIEEDVWRRDFACNALYYNIEDFSLWDYVGAVEDIQARRLRLIGDPGQRYREDPVRMLRAARFEAKLGFSLDADTEAPVTELRHLLTEVPAARLFDETLKLFLTGHGVRSLEVLRRRGLLAALYPAVERALAEHPGSDVERLLEAGLANTDERVQAGKSVTPTFLFTLLLYGPIAAYIGRQPQEKWSDVGTILDGCDAALRETQKRVTIPKRFSLGVRDMFALQPQLEQPRSRRVLRLIEQPRFRAAFDLLLLRAQVGMAPQQLVDWWAALQAADAETRTQMVLALEASRGQRGDGEDEGGEGRPRRRRRRRR
ncbi:MAG TPA: polynucleotide adenylyltransferase PcnB [Steroidobacteraceae bacterium]|nr:polynucleotide adenylyltransferase PcnB [Steroidobacteraceae bacterium]